MERINIENTKNNKPLESISVLVAEDNTMMRMVVCNFLKKWGISFKEAVNGQEAVEKSKINKFDLILMDIEMPIMDGYEAVNVLRKNGVTAPVLAHTSLQHNNILCDLRNGGFNDMVVKPFNPSDLLIRIQHYINGCSQIGFN